MTSPATLLSRAPTPRAGENSALPNLWMENGKPLGPKQRSRSRGPSVLRPPARPGICLCSLVSTGVLLTLAASPG